MAARVERTIESMLSCGFTVHAKCQHCGAHRDLDLRPLLDTLGRNFSFWNRRSACTLRPLCPGWIHYYVGDGWHHLAADEATQARWMSLEIEERQIWTAAMTAAEKNGGYLVADQTDRAAAAAYLVNAGEIAAARNIENRKLDRHPLVQLFARRALLARMRRRRGDRDLDLSPVK